jgi:hypothetical protein
METRRRYVFSIGPCGMILTYTHPGRRQRRRRSQMISRPILSYDNSHVRTVSDRWYRRRAIFMEDTIWSGRLGDEVHVP